MKEDNVLPPDFDGIFRFTNASDRELKCKWNNIEYTYAPKSTSPMIISGATPEEVQHIRKKFAREYAVREFYSSGRYTELNSQALPGSGNTAAIYTDADLAPYIQQCLEPLPVQNAVARQMPRDKTENYHEGTKVLGEKDQGNTSLVGAGSEVITG